MSFNARRLVKLYYSTTHQVALNQKLAHTRQLWHTNINTGNKTPINQGGSGWDNFAMSLECGPCKCQKSGCTRTCLYASVKSNFPSSAPGSAALTIPMKSSNFWYWTASCGLIRAFTDLPSNGWDRLWISHTLPESFFGMKLTGEHLSWSNGGDLNGPSLNALCELPPAWPLEAQPRTPNFATSRVWPGCNNEHNHGIQRPLEWTHTPKHNDCRPPPSWLWLVSWSLAIFISH